MGRRCFPAAGILPAALLVASASALSLLLSREDLSQPPSAPGQLTLQNRSNKLPELRRIFPMGGALSSAKPEPEAPGAAGGLEDPEALSRSRAPPSQPAPLGRAGALNRAISGPTPSALIPKAQPVSSVAGPVGETLDPGPLEAAATLLSQAAPALGSGQKRSKAPRPAQQPTRGPLPPASPAPTSGPPYLLRQAVARHFCTPRARMPSTWRTVLVRLETPRGPREAVSSVPPSRLVFVSTANTTAAPEPLSSAGLDTTSPALTMGSEQSREAVASSQGPEPSDASVLRPASAAPPPQPSSPSSPHPPPPASSSPPLSSPSSPGLSPVSSNTLGARGPLDPSVSAPGHSHTTRSVTFRITSDAFSAALQNPESLEHRLLSERICHQLQPIYRQAFPSFKGVGALKFGPGSADVRASLVFGSWPGPSAREVLWPLYRKVKASRWRLGDLSLVENSLASDGSNLTDLALETVSVGFTAMRPFQPQLLVPSSACFALLEKQILRLVTPLVSGFYKAQPQEGPLLLFSNVDQWVSVSLEYKFQSPIPSHLRGLADHLARSVTDATVQKASIVANGEKAELVLYEMWLWIPGQPFTKALGNKTSLESQGLREQLTRWLTAVLRLLPNFEQVVVEEFRPEPRSAKVTAAFLGAMPVGALVEDCVRLALRLLQEMEGLWVERGLPGLGTPSSGAASQPSAGVPGWALLVLNFLLVTRLVPC